MLASLGGAGPPHPSRRLGGRVGTPSQLRSRTDALIKEVATHKNEKIGVEESSL